MNTESVKNIFNYFLKLFNVSKAAMRVHECKTVSSSKESLRWASMEEELEEDNVRIWNW